MKLKLFCSPWVLVVIGISFNILAAIITNHFIAQNNERLHHIQEQVSAKEVLINTYWQNRQNLEAKKQFLLLYRQLGKISEDKMVKEYVLSFLAQVQKDYQIKLKNHNENKAIDESEIIDLMEEVKRTIIDDIDDVYLEKLILEKEMQPIESNNDQLMGIALFLQMLGLILVLSRDLSRH